MRTLCDRCNVEINTSGDYKGDHAFSYSIEVDTEPNIGTAHGKNESGYLCHKCSRVIYNAISEGIKPINRPQGYNFELIFSH